MQKHFVTTRDSWLSNLVTEEKYEYFKLIIGPNNVGYLRPNINDMLSVFFSNHEEEIYMTRERLTLLDILSTGGGFANTIVLLTKILAKLYAV